MRFGIMFALALGGCGGGTLEDCVGNYTGTFDGDDEGEIAATISADGTLVVTFVSSVGEVGATATVSDDGAITGEDGGTSVSGTMDFGDCSASGAWDTDGAFFGGWQIGLDG